MKNYQDGLKLLPDHMRHGVELYIEKGIPGGSFQDAVFANDFLEAMNTADMWNLNAIRQWAEFLYNYAPASCKGSDRAVDLWIEGGGLEGQLEALDALVEQGQEMGDYD